MKQLPIRQREENTLKKILKALLSVEKGQQEVKTEDTQPSGHLPAQS